MSTSWPSGRALSGPSGVWGREIRADTSREGLSMMGTSRGRSAWSRLAGSGWKCRAKTSSALARRRWRDRGSGVEYRAVDGAPLLAALARKRRGTSPASSSRAASSSSCAAPTCPRERSSITGPSAEAKSSMARSAGRRREAMVADSSEGALERRRLGGSAAAGRCATAGRPRTDRPTARGAGWPQGLLGPATVTS
jgi:hypothetical protein